MPTIDATVGGTSANSYLDDTTAEVMADERLQVAEWDGASADDQARALIMATARLEQLTYKGIKSASGQALKWPRSDVIDENGDEYDSTAIPDLVLHATFETALWLLNQNAASTDPLAPTGLEGFIRAKVGPIEVEPNLGQRAGALPDAVKRMLQPLLAGGSSITAELLRS